MNEPDSISRRRTVQMLGGVAATAVLAGCNDGEGPGEPDDEPDDGEPDEEEANGDEIEPGEIVLDGYTEGWEGVEPDEIAGDDNPPLTLQEGETYEFTWENMDGTEHNIEIWNEDDEVVDDYETELVAEEGETQTLEDVEVTDEMAYYVCEPHQGTMRGDIEVV